MLPGVLKILTPKVLNAIMDYVFKDNNLDQQMAAMQERVGKLENDKCKCCKDKLYRMKHYEGTD